MQLVMPMNYEYLEQEEMMYLDGGAYISRANARQAIFAMGMNLNSYIAATVSVTVVVKTVKWISKKFGGAWGWVAGVIAGWAGSQVLEVARGIGRAALNNGADISWNWNPFKDTFGVNVTVY